MNIYTKTGDKGDTSLVGGTRVSKRDPRVDAYGTIDELIANIAVIRSLCNHSETDTNLRRVQATLMLCAAHIASDGTSDKVKTLDTGEIKFLEEQIDYMQSNMPPQTAFILLLTSAGSPLSCFKNRLPQSRESFHCNERI